MPRPRKLFPHRSVVYITTAMEEGLPMPANPLILLIISGYLARAQSLYPVTICHAYVSSNHLHLIAVVENPYDICNFMKWFKTESAHAINKLLGRRKRTVWCEGYDSPVVLTRKSVINKIVYIYSNPSTDGLEESIDNYPGLSSWQAFVKGKDVESYHPWVRRFMVPEVTGLSLTKISEIAQTLKKSIKAKHLLKITPNAWMECFGVTNEKRKLAINKRIIAMVRENENQMRKERGLSGAKVIGRQKLISRHMDMSYRPNRSGKRMHCISSDIPLRVKFLTEKKAVVAEGRKVSERWKVGDFSVPYPPGLFPPSMPTLV
ncbi:MAG: transposase, partial [Deltaproteobacteria bacterium]|nr:transposase [Deltaproteobacteria bacterium]